MSFWSRSRHGFDRPQRARGLGALTTLGKIVVIGMVVLVAGTVAYFVAARRGGTDSAKTTAVSAHKSLCRHLLGLQVVRVPALTRARQGLREDAKRYAATGNTTASRNITKLAAAVGRVISALKRGANTQHALTEVQRALGTMPNCRGGA
jgi:hypothetical protein